MTSDNTPDLQGLREVLLAPFEVIRDDLGFFCHPALPMTDEEVRADKLLAAFGLQSAFACMEDECDDSTLTESVLEGGSCAAWTPTTPKGEGWLLLTIYDTEEGPHAMFARPAPAIAPARRWRDDQHPEEWRNAERIADAPEVHEALLNFSEDQTGDNGTCVVRAVMRATHPGDADNNKGLRTVEVDKHHAQPAPAVVEPDWYHAECDDPDRSGFYLEKSDAQTQVNDHGGYVTELFDAPQPAPAPVITVEQRRMLGIIAGKIEDGSLFSSGILSRRELAAPILALLAAPQPHQIAEPALCEFFARVCNALTAQDMRWQQHAGTTTECAVAAIEKLGAKPASPWISVAERLPKCVNECTSSGTEVSNTALVYSPLCLGFGHIQDDGKWVIYEGAYDMAPETVTHWMPCPKQPAAAPKEPS